MSEEVREKARKEVREEERTKARVLEARAALRRVLVRRELVLSAEDEARIDACTNLATLRHWLDEATVASSAAEALG